MIILEWQEFLSTRQSWQSLAATVGVFDGVHLGHKTLISHVTSRAPGMNTAVFTFRDNPKKTLHPKTFHGDLYSLEGKLRLIGETGVEHCILIDFSSDFGRLSGSGFLSSLHDQGSLQYIAMGSDFRCGYRLDTDAEALAHLCAASGIESEILGPVNWNGKPISSSRIRKAILDGRVSEAATMLGRPYGIDCGGFQFKRKTEGLYLLPKSELAIAPPLGCYVVILEKNGMTSEGRVEVMSRHWIIRTAVDFKPATIHFIDAV